MKQRIIFLISTILALLALGLLFLRDRPLDKVGGVSIAASLTISPAPIWIAQERGLFARAGLDATVQNCATGKECAEAMLTGEVNLAAAAEFLAARVSFSDKNLRILGLTSFIHTIKLLGIKERGITSVAGLKGKRVGVRLGTNGEYFLARLLALHGMSREAITWVDLKPQVMADALAAGQVDAVLVWPPFTNRIRGQFGDKLVEFDGQPGQDYYYVMLGQQAWLAQNQKTAERVMLALGWAVEWMAAHPGETLAFLADKYGVPAEELEEDLRNTRFSVSLPQSLLSAIEEESRWLAEQGTPGEPPANSLDLIAFDPLNAVAPEAVTMIRGTRPR